MKVQFNSDNAYEETTQDLVKKLGPGEYKITCKVIRFEDGSYQQDTMFFKDGEMLPDILSLDFYVTVDCDKPLIEVLEIKGVVKTVIEE